MGPPHQVKSCDAQYQIKAVDNQVNFLLYFILFLTASIFQSFFYSFKNKIFFFLTQGNKVVLFQPAKAFLPAIQKLCLLLIFLCVSVNVLIPP